MAKLAIVKGTTSKNVSIFLQDSSSATGAGLTGLVFNTASLSAYYYREGAASAVAITLVTATVGTWTSGGFIAADGTNLPGVYVLSLPDAALATGANSVVVMLKGAANLAPVLVEIQLTDVNLHDGVRAGLTALPNAPFGATNGFDCQVVLGGTASAGAATSITLAGGSATDNLYNHQQVRILSGTGAGQVRVIVAYNGTTKVATVDRNWTTTPDNTSVYAVTGLTAMPAWNLFQGLASAGGATSVTLAGGSATSSIYNGALVLITAGTGARQARVATAYNGGTGVVTVDRAWQTNPDSTSVIVILAADLPGADGAGNLSGSVASVTGSVGSLVAAPPDEAGVTTLLSRLSSGRATNLDFLDVAITSRLATAGYTTPPTVGAISTQVWTEPIPGSFAAGSAGAKLNSAGSAGDPWSTAVPGAYGAGTAGFILGTNLNATVSSRLAAASITLAGGAVTVGTNNDKTGYGLAFPDSRVLHSGTAQAGAATTITLAAGASAVDTLYRGLQMTIYSGTGAGQTRIITSYVGATKVATVLRAWITNPDATSLYVLHAADGPSADANLNVKVSGFTGGVISAAVFATDAIDANALATNAATEIAGKVWDEVLASHLTAGSTGNALNAVGSAGDPWSTAIPGAYGAGTAGNIVGNRLDAAVTSRLAPTVASRTLDVAATGEAGLDFDNIKDATGAHPLTNISVPTVTNVTNDVGITQAGADKVWASAARTLTSFGTLAADVWANSTRTLSAFSTGLAVSVWDVLAASVAAANSIGLQLKTNIDAAITSRLATAGYTVPPTVGAISTQVWTEPIPGAFGAGSAGAKLNSAASGTDPWATLVPGAYGAGTAGNILGNRLDAAVSSRAAIADYTSARAAKLDNLDVLLSTRLATSGYSAPPSAATIAAQIIATTLAELPQAQPSATPTVNDALMLPYMVIRNGGSFNKTTGINTIKNGAGVVIAKQTATDDGTTTSETLLVAGP